MANLTGRIRGGVLVACALAMVATAAHGATIIIVNNDAAGEGFNDATAVAPIGGNPGTTRGAQRLNVFNQAAAIWGGILPSTVTIRCASTFDPLTPCNSTSGVLGSTGALAAANNFPGSEVADTWYAIALANKLANVDIDPAGDDMQARFNSSVDNAMCLGTTSWYYGYDHNEGTNVDLLAVILHELAHGLGFASFVDETTGEYFSGLSDIFTHFIYDEEAGQTWEQMDDAGRAASAINDGSLVFNGPQTYGHSPQFLAPRQYVRVDAPPSIQGEKVFGAADFGDQNWLPIITGEVVLVNDGVAPTSDGCESPFVNAGALNGKIALVDRGVCNFTVKAVNAEDAGAIGTIIVNNVASPAVIGMTGLEPGVVKPAVMISLADGNAIKSALLSGQVFATIGADPLQLSGTTAAGRVKLYAPNPVQPGSSVSHFDVSATPNLLMEPAINSSLTNNVDLTRYAFEDIGWFPRLASVDPTSPQSLRLEGGAPNPFRVRTAIRYTLGRPGFADMSIYDVTGRQVKNLMKSWQPAGSGQILWDATSEGGERVKPGVYLYRVRANGDVKTQRVVVSD